MNNLFITGGTGFFGKNILSFISNSEDKLFYKISILTRNSTKFLNDFQQFNTSQFEFINGYVRDFQYIMHLATDASKDLNDNNPLEMMDVILNGRKNILEFAKKKIMFFFLP